MIITDNGKKDIAKQVFQEAFKLCKAVKLHEMPVMERNGQEPPAEVAEEMKKFDVVFLITTFSLSHTKARREASAAGARIASMPGITREIIQRCIPVDYNRMKARINRLCDYFDQGKRVAVTTKKGTNLEFSIVGRKGHGRKGGIYDKKGYWGNLPCGEAFVAPVEGTANGVLVVDGPIASIGKVDKNAVIEIQDGFATKFSGGKAAKLLEEKLKRVGKLAFNVAEFGIGANEKAKITGTVLEDEKVLGTIHVAFGNNVSMEGKVDVPVHIDCVVKRPNIWIDEKKIMQDGKILI